MVLNDYLWMIAGFTARYLGIYYFMHCIYLVIMNNHSELYLEKFGKKLMKQLSTLLDIY